MPRGRRMTKIDIEFISLVPEGANRRYFIAKADGRFELAVQVRKVDAVKKQVTGVVYGIGELDTHGDFATEADFDAAMHAFMRKGRVAAGIAGDIEHDETPTEDYFCAVWKIQEGDPLFPNDAGAWAVTRQIVVDETWGRVEKGELKAFSFGGSAMVQEDVQVTKADKAKLAKRAVALAKASIADDMDRRQVTRLLESICNTLWETYYEAPADTEDEKAALREVLEEAQSLMKTNKEAGFMPKLKNFFTGVAALAKQYGEEEEPETTVKDAEPAAPEPPAPSAEEAKGPAEPTMKEAAALLQDVVTKAMTPVVQRLDALEKGAPLYVPSDRLDINTSPGSTQVWKGTFANIPGWNSSEPPTVGEYLDAKFKGLLSPTAASTMSPEVLLAFLARVADATPFMKGITRVTVKAPNQRIPKLDVSPRRSRIVIPNSDPAITGNAMLTERTLNPIKLMTPYDIEEDWYADNVLGDNAETWLETQMGRVWGLDNCDLGMNGDTDITPQAEPDDSNFLCQNDGWIKIAENDSATHKFDHDGSTDYLNVVFPGTLAMIPPKFRGLALKFFVDQDIYDAYVDQIAGRPTVRGDSYLLDGAKPLFKGYPVEAVPQMCADIETNAQKKIILTPHSNFVMGVWFELQYLRERRFRKDIIEHTLKGRTDYEIRDADALVIAANFS